MTTTSFKTVASDFSLTDIFVLPETFTFSEMNPRDENSNTSLLPAVIEYLPSTSVKTPVFVPFISTPTPGSGSPLSSVTVPVILFLAVWADAGNKADRSSSAIDTATPTILDLHIFAIIERLFYCYYSLR